jgi:MFS family permease
VWLVFGSGLAFQLLAESYAAYALVVDPESLPAPRTIPRLLGLGGPLALAFAPFLFLLFPTGRLPSRRWRPIAWIAAVSGAVLFALALLFDNPDTVGGAITAIAVAVATAIFAAIVISALSLVVRYRRVSGVERQQLKWFALAAVLAAGYIVGQLLSEIVGELLNLDWLRGEAFWNLLDAATNTALYVAVGVAMLRYRLYDIDLIINRALVYGPLTAMLALVYVGSVVGLQGALRVLTGQESTLAVVASTLVIAALFSPLRRRVQAFVDRRFYRRKYDAAKILAAFSARLREETRLDALGEDLIGVVTRTVQPAHASLWLRSEPGGKGEQAD